MSGLNIRTGQRRSGGLNVQTQDRAGGNMSAGSTKGPPGPTGASIVSTELYGQDENGGNIYKQTFDNGEIAFFTAPKGAKGDKGEKGDPGTPDKFFTFTQSVAASVWMITHNLGKYPSVSVVDSGGNVVVGDVKYNGVNTLTINFASAFSGTAYLN